MLEQLAEEDSGRRVIFVHAARNGASHLFDDETKGIAARARNGGVKVLSCYSRPEVGDRSDLIGHLDADVIAALLPPQDADFYLCGPSAFLRSVGEGLIERGASTGSIRFEAFDASGAVVSGPGRGDGARCKVTFAKSGKAGVWNPPDGSLLDFALVNGVDVPYSCRIGDCQSCVQRIVTGVVDYPGGEEPLLAYGQVLLCQAIPRGDLWLDI